MSICREELILSLAASALGTRQSDEPVLLRLGEWKALFETSVAHNVGAMVFDELQRRQTDIPEDVSKAWGEYKDFSLGRFDAHLMSLNILSATLESEGVRMLTLKGFGLALAYPKPSLRECVDIDIYCFDDFDRVNGLVVSTGISEKAELTEEKHVCFEVSGIEVENHSRFTTEINRANVVVGKALEKMSREEPLTDPRLPGILFPSPTMGALHLLMHTLTHLAWSGISIRHLCDVTAYFGKYQDCMDIGRIRAVLKDAGIEPAATLLLRICVARMGLSMDLNGWDDGLAAESDRFFECIVHPFEGSSETRNPIGKVVRKVRQYRFRSYLHFLVYGERFTDSFLLSFAFLKRLKERFCGS